MGWFGRIGEAAEHEEVLRGAKILTAALVVYFAGAFLYVSLSRMGYEFTLEWLEGASLIQVERLLSGLPLYAPPTFDYVALIYSPLYFYVAALFARILGFGFLPLRLVSFLSTLGCVGMVYLIVRKYTSSQFASWMAAGSFLALYRISDTWFDLARVDMLAVFLTLLAVHLIGAGTPFKVALAGIAISLAALAKQTYWFLVPPALLYAAFLHGKRALYMALATAIVSIAAHLVLDRFYQGWYSFFVYSTGFEQGSSVFEGGLRHFFAAYWIDVVARVVPILFLLFGLYFVLRIRDYRSTLALLALGGGMIVLSWMGLLNKGGFNNVLIPSLTIFLIGAWLCMAEMLKRPGVSNLARSGLLLLYAGQLVMLLYPVAPLIPTQEDARAGQALVQALREQPGDVYLPYDNYLALYAGKRPFAGLGSLGDLNQVSGGVARREWNSINARLREMIRGREFSLIILDENAEWGSAERYYRSYYRPEAIPYVGDAFFPVAGWQIRPALRYSPIPAP